MKPSPKGHQFESSNNDPAFCNHCSFPAADHSLDKWYSRGFGMFVIIALQKRCPGFESGVIHHGGISTGKWTLAWGLDAKAARRVKDILDLYQTEVDFLADD